MFDNTVEENVNIHDMHKRFNKQRMHYIKEDLKELNRIKETKETENNIEEIKFKMKHDLKKKKVPELKQLCKEKGIQGYSKLKKNEIIEKIVFLHFYKIEHEQHTQNTQHVHNVKSTQPVQSVEEMAEEVKRMRKECLKRTRQFRGDVIRHQESIQESVDRSKKRQEQRNRFINERRYPAQGLTIPTVNRRNISRVQQMREDFGILPKKQRTGAG